MARVQALVVLQTYAALRQAVLAVVIKGRRSIDDAWLRTYHETGRLIHAHLLLHKARANYGGQVFARLAADIGSSSRSLHEYVQFYRCFPIVWRAAQLNWNHYRVLCQVPDAARREELLRETIRNNWYSKELELRVRAMALPKPDNTEMAKDVTPPKLLTPKRGTPGVCRAIADGDGVAVDLGFACCLRPGECTGIEVNDFVQVTKTGIVRLENATKADLFTYRAEVLKVVDGDTLWVKVLLRPDWWIKQKLRLRDLDCPEMSTAEGRAAKKFVDALVAEVESVTICTTKPDKYDRYLADVFLTLSDDREVFLNNELLANGHAVSKKSWEFGDWGE